MLTDASKHGTWGSGWEATQGGYLCPLLPSPPSPSSWHLEGVICTWVAEPQGGGGATLLAALGATHRLLTTKGPAGVFPYTTPAPRWHLQPCRAGSCLGPVAAAVLWGIGDTVGLKARQPASLGLFSHLT